ncbi:MAG TPA: discoidin domain-containing protein, partial [Rhodoglobus sp.]|nr:discoidin domain-containing protein [Rhodoglobus sp.]
DDLAATATVTASSTLREIAVVPDAGEPVEQFSLAEHEVGLLFPVRPSFEGVELAVTVTAPTELELELWSTAGGENHIPVTMLDRASVALAQPGEQRVLAPFAHRSEAGENVVLVLRRNEHVALLVVDRPGPYGLLGLVSRTPRTASDRAQSNAWSAEELRRKAPVLRVLGESSAYAPRNAVEGYARPFDGPNLWSSAPLRDDQEPRLELTWLQPQPIATVEVVLNDDVDIDLVNLHHHRTPFAVMPELVRDYRIEIADAAGWRTVAEVRDNRHRRQVHRLDEAVQADRLRFVATATNGSQWVSVVALRVYAD